MVIFRLIIFLFLTATLHAQNPYELIYKRNAFKLTTDTPKPSLPPVTIVAPPVDIYLTGITRHKSPKAHLAIKGKGITSHEYLSLKEGEKKGNISVIKILKNSVIINNGVNNQQISFKTHGMPTVIMKAPTVVKIAEKGSKSSSKSIKPSSPAPPTPKPQIVPVPSRRPKIDPRIIQRGLEYLEKVEDSDKKKYILEKLERLQSGQEKMDRKIDSNERRRRYDEYKRDRQGK
tara:strand:+ start:660 stop:1355 length:696 start_codon:yes stop_codon:yes gene_type:complete